MDVKTGKESNSYQYYQDKAEKYTRLGVTPEILMFSYNLLHQLKKTRIQAIEYVTTRKTMPYDIRQHSVEFLSAVNKFLSSVTDVELDNILHNPKQEELLFNRFKRTVEAIVDKPDREKHIIGFTRTLMKLFKEYKDAPPKLLQGVRKQ